MSRGYGKAQRAILEFLLEGRDESYSESVGDMARDLDLAQPTVSRALKRLESDGLVVWRYDFNECFNHRVPRRHKYYTHVDNVQYRDEYLENWRIECEAKEASILKEAAERGVSVDEVRVGRASAIFDNVLGK